MTTNRLRGVLMGQFVGDALGARYEFKTATQVQELIANDMRKAKNGILPMLGGGPFNLEAGEVTDDSQMALSMAGCLLMNGGYDQATVATAYVRWQQSNPPDIGNTTAAALTIVDRIPKDWPKKTTMDERRKVLQAVLNNVRVRNPTSQSNGCLMRICPLPVLFHHQTPESWAPFVQADVALTHGHPTPANACLAYTLAIHQLINGRSAEETYQNVLTTVNDSIVRRHLELAATQRTPIPYGDGLSKWTNGDDAAIGYLGIALQVSFYELLHAKTFDEGLMNAIRVGGDTDTNGCITAALLGARFGEDGIPEEWRKKVENAKNRLKDENGITNIKDLVKAFEKK